MSGIEMRGAFDFSKLYELRGLPAGLEAGGAVIKDAAVENVAKENDRLANSAKLEVDAEARQAAIRFTAPYAAMEHEFYYYHHPHGGGADYLGGALRHRVDESLGAVAKEIKAEL